MVLGPVPGQQRFGCRFSFESRIKTGATSFGSSRTSGLSSQRESSLCFVIPFAL
ncbi:hypothetical protein Hanom_Chr06g00520591 [Helianthus anomalus]